MHKTTWALALGLSLLAGPAGCSSLVYRPLEGDSGYLRVERHGLWVDDDNPYALASPDGRLLTPFKYAKIGTLVDDRVRVRVDTFYEQGGYDYVYGYLDGQGREVIPLRFEGAPDPLGETGWVEHRGYFCGWRLIDHDGRPVHDLRAWTPGPRDEFLPIGDGDGEGDRFAILQHRPNHHGWLALVTADHQTLLTDARYDSIFVPEKGFLQFVRHWPGSGLRDEGENEVALGLLNEKGVEVASGASRFARFYKGFAWFNDCHHESEWTQIDRSGTVLRRLHTRSKPYPFERFKALGGVRVLLPDRAPVFRGNRQLFSDTQRIEALGAWRTRGPKGREEIRLDSGLVLDEVQHLSSVGVWLGRRGKRWCALLDGDTPLALGGDGPLCITELQRFPAVLGILGVRTARGWGLVAGGSVVVKPDNPDLIYALPRYGGQLVRRLRRVAKAGAPGAPPSPSTVRETLSRATALLAFFDIVPPSLLNDSFKSRVLVVGGALRAMARGLGAPVLRKLAFTTLDPARPADTADFDRLLSFLGDDPAAREVRAALAKVRSRAQISERAARALNGVKGYWRTNRGVQLLHDLEATALAGDAKDRRDLERREVRLCALIAKGLSVKAYYVLLVASRVSRRVVAACAAKLSAPDRKAFWAAAGGGGAPRWAVTGAALTHEDEGADRPTPPPGTTDTAGKVPAPASGRWAESQLRFGRWHRVLLEGR